MDGYTVTHTHTHTHMKYIQTRAHTCTCTHTRAYMHTCINTLRHTQTHYIYSHSLCITICHCSHILSFSSLSRHSLDHAHSKRKGRVQPLGSRPAESRKQGGAMPVLTHPTWHQVKGSCDHHVTVVMWPLCDWGHVTIV